tara:strand:+ start:483 stop:1169 length:687 start_codon:yes stop_codon:yes gene_type:complete
MKNKKVIIALDNDNLNINLDLVKELRKEAFAFKIGYEFFFNFGFEGYELIQKLNTKIFLDLKLHDIPNTVKNGINAITKLKPYFTTIHISGGDEMQKSANISKVNTKILGVSLLTSLDSAQIEKYYFNKNIEDVVSKFIYYALENNLDGIVCSPKEIKIVKKIIKNKMLIITPGIRPENYKNPDDDQKRTMTPKEAIKAGANYLVIGRPITKASNPLKEIQAINTSLV